MRFLIYSFLNLLVLLSLAAPASSMAQDGQCETGTFLEQTFGSGAHWTMCATVDQAHGLSISKAHYRAPGDTSRSVLRLAHLGQILLHYHDQGQAVAQVQDPPLDNHRLLSMTAANCDGVLLLPQDGAPRLCSRIEQKTTLARYWQRPSLHGQNWELSSALQRDGLTWAVAMTFTEDGSIVPSVSLSGRATQFNSDPRFAEPSANAPQGITRANVLTTWRLVFDLDTPGNDLVEQFDFAFTPTSEIRRPMQVNQLSTETFAKVERKNFRGWRVLDSSGAGYYLDPSNSGFNYQSSSSNWAQFDLAVTRFKPCEIHALANQASTDCGQTLDDFMSGESLLGEHPVLWFSQSRALNPSNDDWPVIRNFYQSFTLLPFDWTASSPFEVNE